MPYSPLLQLTLAEDGALVWVVKENVLYFREGDGGSHLVLTGLVPMRVMESPRRSRRRGGHEAPCRSRLMRVRGSR